jgi:hypothetical protein
MIGRDPGFFDAGAERRSLAILEDRVRLITWQIGEACDVQSSDHAIDCCSLPVDRNTQEQFAHRAGRRLVVCVCVRRYRQRLQPAAVSA